MEIEEKNGDNLKSTGGDKREGAGERFRGKKVTGRLTWCQQKMRKGAEGILKQQKKMRGKGGQEAENVICKRDLTS